MGLLYLYLFLTLSSNTVNYRRRLFQLLAHYLTVHNYASFKYAIVSNLKKKPKKKEKRVISDMWYSHFQNRSQSTFYNRRTFGAENK